MDKVLEIISKEVGDAFEKAGYDRELGRVTISNRPDLCEYQCNGAMAGAKKYGKAPFMIADDVAANLAGNEMFEKVESVKPGFLNIIVSGDFARGEKYVNDYFIWTPEMETMAQNIKNIQILVISL